MIGSVVAPVFAGLVYDVRQSYRVAFLAIALVNFLCVLFLIPVGKPTSAAAKLDSLSSTDNPS